MPSSVARYHDPNAEAKLLLGFVAVALVAGTGYICYSRLHVRKEQLMEASLYILAWSFVFWDVLRYTLTAPAEKEDAWPHPPLRISRKQDNQAIQKAFADDSIVIGYDIHQKPVLWPDEVRVMQANGFGMTGAGKTTLLLNIIQQDLVRETGPKDSRHKIPLIIIDGKGEREFLDDKLLPLIAAAGQAGRPAHHRSRPPGDQRPLQSFHCHYRPVPGARQLHLRVLRPSGGLLPRAPKDVSLGHRSNPLLHRQALQHLRHPGHGVRP